MTTTAPTTTGTGTDEETIKALHDGFVEANKTGKTEFLREHMAPGPEALLWYNPFAAQYDVICGASDGYGGWCSRLADLTNGAISIGIGGGATGGAVTAPGVGVDTSGGAAVDIGGKVVADVAPVQPFGIRRDTFWPRSVAAWLALSAVLVLASVQLVSPTRRWRIPIRRAPPRNA